MGLWELGFPYNPADMTMGLSKEILVPGWKDIKPSEGDFVEVIFKIIPQGVEEKCQWYIEENNENNDDKDNEDDDYDIDDQASHQRYHHYFHRMDCRGRQPPQEVKEAVKSMTLGEKSLLTKTLSEERHTACSSDNLSPMEADGSTLKNDETSPLTVDDVVTCTNTQKYTITQAYEVHVLRIEEDLDYSPLQDGKVVIRWSNPSHGVGCQKPEVFSDATVHYRLYNLSTDELVADTYSTKTPLTFRVGCFKVMPAFEIAVKQMLTGSQANVKCAPCYGFGPLDDFLLLDNLSTSAKQLYKDEIMMMRDYRTADATNWPNYSSSLVGVPLELRDLKLLHFTSKLPPWLMNSEQKYQHTLELRKEAETFGDEGRWYACCMTLQHAADCLEVLLQALCAGQPPVCTVKAMGGATDGCSVKEITIGDGWNDTVSGEDKKGNTCSKHVDNEFWGEPDISVQNDVSRDDSHLSCEELEENEEPRDNICDEQPNICDEQPNICDEQPNICDEQRVDENASVSLVDLRGRVNSSFTDVLSDLCVANVKCGEFSEGLKVANLVLCERPKDVRALCAKVECMRAFDDLEGARLVIEFAASLDPESREVAEEAVKIKLQMDEEALRYKRMLKGLSGKLWCDGVVAGIENS